MSAKPQLTPPPGPPPSARLRPNPDVRLVVGLVVALLVVVALGVVLILPAQIAPQSSTATAPLRAADVSAAAPMNTAPPTAASATDSAAQPAAGVDASPQRDQVTDAPQQSADASPVTPARDAQSAAVEDQKSAGQGSKAAAESSLREALKRQVRLENMGVTVWGAQLLDTSYEQVQATLAGAGAEFAAGRYEAAAQGYREASRELDTLEASRPARLQAALANARAALANDKAQSAAEAFELALALEPGNAEAAGGLERARQRPLALAELERGRALELSGDLQSASVAYAAALAIETDFAAALSAAKEVAERIRNNDFMSALAEAEAAADARRYATARRALARVPRTSARPHR